jgi:hypothetical protein
VIHVRGLEPVWISKIHKVPRKYHRCEVGLFVPGRCDCSCELPKAMAKLSLSKQKIASAADVDFAAVDFKERLLQLSKGGLKSAAWLPSG